MHALYPVTITTKITECKEFYCQLFGFEIVFEADWYVQLLHRHSGVEIGLMQPHLANQPQDLQAAFGGHGIIYSLEVADAASEYGLRAVMLQSPIHSPLRHGARLTFACAIQVV